MKQPFCAPSEALRRVLDAAAALPKPAAETLPLDDAVSRIAAEPLSARMDQPPVYSTITISQIVNGIQPAERT